MAKSRARRQRRHKMRNGERFKARAPRPDFSTHVRKTPSKQARIERKIKKYKDWRHQS